MNRSYRWGILGAGKIAEKFASAVNYVEGSEIFAIASRDGNKARAFAEKYGASHVHDEYRKLAEDPDIDIIYIATPHAFHCEQAILCLNHKKPVLSEKPMALNYRQVKDMVDASTVNNTFLMEGMWSRFMPSINKVLELINEDVIGPVQFIRADFGFQAPYDPHGRLYNLKLGGGSLLDVGIYPIFLTTLLLGEPSNIQSMAKLADTGADEYCSMQFQYAGDQVANIFSSVSIKTSLTAEISGTKGRIILPAPFYKATSMAVELNTGESNSFLYPYEHNGFEYEVREVMQCLDKGMLQSALLTHDTSLMMARIMDTVREQCKVVY
jgi:predicted dehydrogenase